jgi:hypothetical protein
MSKELNTIKQEEITTVQLAAVDLRKFPPKLRQLGKYLLQSDSNHHSAITRPQQRTETIIN